MLCGCGVVKGQGCEGARVGWSVASGWGQWQEVRCTHALGGPVSGVSPDLPCRTHLHNASPPRFTSWVACAQRQVCRTISAGKHNTRRAWERCLATGAQARAFTYNGEGRRMPRRSARTAPGVTRTILGRVRTVCCAHDLLLRGLVARGTSSNYTQDASARRALWAAVRQAPGGGAQIFDGRRSSSRDLTPPARMDNAAMACSHLTPPQ